VKERYAQIGFSHRVRLEWLERTANLLLSGTPERKIREELDALLYDKVSIGKELKNSNRSKVITNLMRVWVTVPEDLRPLRDEGLTHLRTFRKDSHIVLHWGMAMAVYPFWSVVAETVGRLIRLQGNMIASEAQRRLRERYGERETVARSARRIIRSFVDWGVLTDTNRKGVYEAGELHRIDSVELAAWFIEAFLNSISSGKAQVGELLRNPALFPFALPALKGDQVASVSPRMENVSHSLNEDMVMLC